MEVIKKNMMARRVNEYTVWGMQGRTGKIKVVDLICYYFRNELIINGYRIDILRFADDVAILVDNENHLNKILGTIEQGMENDLIMKINANKSRVLVSSRETRIRIKLQDVKSVKRIEDFICLGSTISLNERCKK